MKVALFNYQLFGWLFCFNFVNLCQCQLYSSRAVAIRFGVVRFVVRVQECYMLGGSGSMLPQKKFGNSGAIHEIASETTFEPIPATKQNFT